MLNGKDLSHWTRTELGPVASAIMTCLLLFRVIRLAITTTTNLLLAETICNRSPWLSMLMDCPQHWSSVSITLCYFPA